MIRQRANNERAEVPGPRIVGLDLSLTATGIAGPDGVDVLKVILRNKATELQRTQRLHTLAVLIDKACRWADLVVIEGPSFGSRAGQAHNLGELAGVVKCILLQRHIPYVIVAPATMKKYATGVGNASKEAVLTAAVKRGAPVSTFDEADAWWLRQMALAAYEHPAHILVPSKNQEALRKIYWPKLRSVEVNDA